jgi:hypothetical protein
VRCNASLQQAARKAAAAVAAAPVLLASSPAFAIVSSRVAEPDHVVKENAPQHCINLETSGPLPTGAQPKGSGCSFVACASSLLTRLVCHARVLEPRLI